MAKLSTDPYKGVRDFYPEDMAIQNYIFDTWKKVAEKFGYQEYSASILEPAELYKNKTSEEIVSKQTFTFIDRGDREVVLRPEMTPTLARMVAAKRRELKYPLRWFSIPNVFRYEQPQKGRKREHWQLNCDLMGIAGIEAEVEIISLIHSIMKAFGAKDSDFKILINSREAKMRGLREKYPQLTEEQERRVLRLRDSKDKISKEEFLKGIGEIIGENINIELEDTDSEESENVSAFIKKVKEMGIDNIEFAPTLTRGFDYYTGIIFEVVDADPDNKRSILGGGRYDNLLEMFEVAPLPAIGFGMGDITLKDFLETHQLGPYNK